MKENEEDDNSANEEVLHKTVTMSTRRPSWIVDEDVAKSTEKKTALNHTAPMRDDGEKATSFFSGKSTDK